MFSKNSVKVWIDVTVKYHGNKYADYVEDST